MENIASLVEISAVIISAVWAISEIKSTTARLGDRIIELKDAIKELKGSMTRTISEIDELKERVTRLEARLDQ